MKINTAQSSYEASLKAIRASAPSRPPTVRALTAYAEHSECNLATLGFAASVDFERLLAGTRYEAPFGQSPFAFSRGLAFERIIAARGYSSTLELLRTTMGFAVDDARIVNLRDIYPKNRAGMRLRANAPDAGLQHGAIDEIRSCRVAGDELANQGTRIVSRGTISTCSLRRNRAEVT